MPEDLPEDKKSFLRHQRHSVNFSRYNFFGFVCEKKFISQLDRAGRKYFFENHCALTSNDLTLNQTRKAYFALGVFLMRVLLWLLLLASIAFPLLFCVGCRQRDGLIDTGPILIDPAVLRSECWYGENDD